MLYVSKDGIVDAERVEVRTFSNIERGKLDKVNGIVVHQTNGPTAQSAFNSYRNPGAKGAHFLIDRDGTIYQTASLHKVTIHVGLLQSRCLSTRQCTPAEFKHMRKLEDQWRPQETSKREYAKRWPERYPINSDAIGIEIVGASKEVPGKKYPLYESVNDQQNASLKWLVKELADTLGVSMSEVYRHPDIARKTPTEAASARW
ncbi:MAG: N-acetylmuramoyl-L-alanine amidase [Variovorax sp.]|nr:N-acetylmuramoyl-L-alanine amidase [Variovorax sp.]